MPEIDGVTRSYLFVTMFKHRAPRCLGLKDKLLLDPGPKPGDPERGGLSGAEVGTLGPRVSLTSPPWLAAGTLSGCRVKIPAFFLRIRFLRIRPNLILFRV